MTFDIGDEFFVDPDNLIYSKPMSPEKAARFRKRREQIKARLDRFRESLKDNPEKRAKRIADKKRSKKANPEANAAYQARVKNDDYHRPFITIDAEGQDYPGFDDIEEKHGLTDQLGNPVLPPKTVYHAHHTFLWGAKGWARKHSACALENASEEDRQGMLLEGANTTEHWLGDASKKPLTSLEILDWLASLPEKFGPENGFPNGVNFVAFGFSYDVTQILKGLPFETAYEISRREKYGTRRRVKGFTFWKDYAIEYLKGKYLKIWKLKPNEDSWIPKLDVNGKPVLKANGKPKMALNSVAHICIYDTFGFYQESLVKAIETLVKKGYLSAEDYQIIVDYKAKRNEFKNHDFETIKEYCSLELTALSKALTLLRDGTDKIGIRLNSWSGAGAAANAFIKKEELKEKHYSPDIATHDISIQQDRAHHTFFGGRIELIKQGYAKDKVLHVYDIASAYPSACLEIPSMRDGTWTHGDNLDAHEVAANPPNILSMFRVIWDFPVKSDLGVRLPIPFFPFSYRTRKKGLILFPSAGHAWLMRDELLAGLEWFRFFFPTRNVTDYLRIEQYSLFHPANGEQPYYFLPDMYEWRKTSKAKGDIIEKVIKLIINSLYGKTAQSVGGNLEKRTPPPSACPYYASAITAWCRAQVLKAALKDPYSIVSFMTDGIVSEIPLDLGERLKPDGSPDVQLGDWEYKQVMNGIFAMSGIYSYGKEVEENGEKKTVETAKSRGFDPKKIKTKKPDGSDPNEVLLGKTLSAFFLEHLIPTWMKAPVTRADGVEEAATLIYHIRRYISAGEACASPDRFKLAGRWADVPRVMNVQKPGPKRDFADGYGWAVLIDPKLKAPSAKELRKYEAWFDIPAQEMQACIKAGVPLRCRYLVPTIPARNLTPEKLSVPAYPEWLEGEKGGDDAEARLSMLNEHDWETVEALMS